MALTEAEAIMAEHGLWEHFKDRLGYWGLLTLRFNSGPPFTARRVWEKTDTGWADKDGRTPEAMGFTVLAWMPLPRPFDTSKSNTLSMEWKTP